MKKFLPILGAIIVIVAVILLYTHNKNAYAYDKSVCANHLVQGDSCLSDFYQKLVATYDEKVAIEDLKKRYAENGFVAAQCHPMMHIIGAEASKKYPSVSEAYLHGDVFCWSGYYHGVMEGVIARIGEEALPGKLNTICSEIPGKESYNFDYFNCVHGLGHGIMELKEDNLFDSLKMCDNLTGDWEQQSCQSGVFMENIVSYEHTGHSDYLKKTEPLYPCTAVDSKYKFQCYLGQTSFALEVSGYSFEKVAPLCATVEEPFRDICNQSLGRDAANQAGHNATRTKNTCYIPKDQNDRTNCIIGAVKEIISYYHSDREAKAFCSVLDKTNEKTECLQTTEAYYKIF